MLAQGVSSPAKKKKKKKKKKESFLRAEVYDKAAKVCEEVVWDGMERRLV